MSIAIINLSPRKQGTSAMLSKYLKTCLSKPSAIVHYLELFKKDEMVIPEIEQAGTIIFIGPCYINTYPADALKAFELLERKGVMANKNVYGMIQGGMPTVHTHQHGLLSLEVFSEQTNALYKGGFVMGLGALLNGRTVEHLPNGKQVNKQLLQFVACINNSRIASPDIYKKSELQLPVFVLKLLAGKMNRSIIKNLTSHNIAYQQESPYWGMYNESERREAN